MFKLSSGKLLFAVSLLLAQPVLAQPSVSLFGMIDVSWINSRAGDLKRSAIESGAHDLSVIGFRGEEALADDLKAVFALEYSVAVDGNGGLGASQFGSRSLSRYQYVGLAGPWGTLIAGRVGSPMNQLQEFDAFGGSMFSPLLAVLPTTLNYRTDFTRLSNSVRFTSPTVHGLRGVVSYSFAPFAGDAAPYSGAQERVLAANLGYTDGPFSVIYGYQQTNERATSPRADLRDHGVGMAYDFDLIKVMGLVLHSNRSGPAGPHSMDEWIVGFTVPVLTHDILRLGFGQMHDRSLNKSGASTWSLGYDHSLSKHTLVYAGYNQIANDPMAAFSADPYNKPLTGDNARLFGLGVRHSF